MSGWLVRQEGSTQAVNVDSPVVILTALRDEQLLPTDEVKGPTDTDWMPLEAHPLFAEAAEELEQPPPESADETHLDMNPLIDVCLVLLIFFILTITYASLERAIDIPEEPEDESAPKMQIEDIRDQVFVVSAIMYGERPVVRLEKNEVAIENLAADMKALMDKTGKRGMVLDIDPVVPWGIETAILDAAKGNNVSTIYNNQRK